ncbi:hypothetical protein AYI70_g1259 [Smittium culicis]|uniref:Uncharacterized protein n=1 Tax=Smittium culicis TaxID=133412 RepID=A0A1R1YDB4_9FUNG|nr:hypothetical protein AYI70_g1259 [Smittium culicis]
MDAFLEFFYTRLTKPLLTGKLPLPKMFNFFRDDKIALKTDKESINDVEDSPEIRKKDKGKLKPFPKSSYQDNKPSAQIIVNKFVISVMSATLANIISQWLIYPLDTVMLNFLFDITMNGGAKYTSHYDCFRKLLKSGGVSRLYFGFLQNISADFFCFYGFLELTNISATILLQYTWPSIARLL